MALNLPEGFKSRMQSQLGQGYEAFIAALKTKAPVSVRHNPAKPPRLSYEQEICPWEDDAFYLKERPSFTYDPFFHAGAYYVQEASSMLIGYIAATLPGREHWSLAIDLCAAPGGKTTHLLSVLPSNVFVLANEVVNTRLGALRQNLIKWGHTNSATISYAAENIAASGLEADLCLIDAPCSGEGLFRKDPESIGHWNDYNLLSCEKRQADILASSPGMVRAGGFLIYSTCTYNPGENMEQVHALTTQGYFESMEVSLDSQWGITRLYHGDCTGYQCYPHLVRGEGFFFSLLKRTSKAWRLSHTGKKVLAGPFKRLNKDQQRRLPPFLQDFGDQIVTDPNTSLYLFPDQLQSLQKYLNVKPLFELGNMKGNELVPSHSLSMMPGFDHCFPPIDLTREQSIQYLKREVITGLPSLPKGWYLVKYEGRSLGFVKVLDNRINNYLPNNLRILK